jgi:hypothetical protein
MNSAGPGPRVEHYAGDFTLRRRGLARGAGHLLGFGRRRIDDDEALLLVVVAPGGRDDDLQFTCVRHHVVDRGLRRHRAAEVGVVAIELDRIARLGQLGHGSIGEHIELAEGDIEAVLHHRVDHRRARPQISASNQLVDDVIDVLGLGGAAVVVAEFGERLLDGRAGLVDVVDRVGEQLAEVGRIVIVRAQHDAVHGLAGRGRGEAEGNGDGSNADGGDAVVVNLETLHGLYPQ